MAGCCCFPLLTAPHGSLLLAGHCTLRLLVVYAMCSFAVFLSPCTATHRVPLLNAQNGPQSGAGCLQEKFELARGLKEQQRLAGVLADENQAMTDEFNRQVCQRVKRLAARPPDACLPRARLPAARPHCRPAGGPDTAGPH